MIASTGCSIDKKEDNNLGENLYDFIIGIHKDDIYQTFGEPIGKLSGFNGDIYTLDNGTVITLYYDGNEKVENLLINDKSGSEIFKNE